MYQYTEWFTAKEASMLTLNDQCFLNFRERVYAGIRRAAALGLYEHTESFADDPTIGICLEMKLLLQELRKAGFDPKLSIADNYLTITWPRPGAYLEY